MYSFFALLSGVFTSVLVMANGRLSAFYGLHSAAFIVNVVALLIVTVIVLIKKVSLKTPLTPLYLYAGGCLGVLVTFCNNMSFGNISVSALLALGLLGQTLMGLTIDQFGLFAMPVHKFKPRKLLGLAVMLVGCSVMIQDFHLVAVLLSILAGILLSIIRCANGALAARTNVLSGVFWTHVAAIICSLIVFILLGRGEPVTYGFTISTDFVMYLGGICSIGIVILSNICVSKIAAYSMAIFIFVGQIFSGLAIDAILEGSVSITNLTGGLFVAVGLALDTLLERRAQKKMA